MPDSFPGRLKILRKRLGCTQAQMAERLQVSLSLYSKLEIGIGKASAALIEKICRQFGLSESWLLQGTGDLPADIALPAESASAPAMPSEEQIIRILELSQEPATRALAGQIAETLQISLAQALAVLVKENWESGRR